MKNEKENTAKKSSWFMRVLVLVFFVLTGAGTLALWAFSISKHNVQPVPEVRINIQRGDGVNELITKGEVDSIVHVHFGMLIGTPINQIDVGAIQVAVDRGRILGQRKTDNGSLKRGKGLGIHVELEDVQQRIVL